jgi:hypothetical protein
VLLEGVAWFLPGRKEMSVVLTGGGVFLRVINGEKKRLSPQRYTIN